MARSADLSNSGRSYGKGMGSREVTIQGVEGINGDIKVLVTNKECDAHRWCNCQHVHLAKKEADQLGIGFVQGPLRKEGTLGMISFVIRYKGELRALVLEGKQSRLPMSAGDLLGVLGRSRVYGTDNCLSVLRLTSLAHPVTAGRPEVRLRAVQGPKEPVANGSMDEYLVLKTVVDAAVSLATGKGKD